MSEAAQGRPNGQRVKQIFHDVRETTGPERERLLRVLCGDDDLLRARVEALLEADAEATDFLDGPTVDAANEAARAAAGVAASDPAESPGSRIGPYKLLQRIGEGGFGVVYMAEQEEPIRRRVALKVIKPGMDTKQVIARFEAERQALAMLDHPNIAKVFDAGTTPAGRPYFVMELVKGIPITDYCDEQRLGARERLELFAGVCGAVHHAHEHGIIHRDIKPSNILVTLHDGTPVPKVIDFGVAKAIRQKLTESTLFTEYHQFIGTPEYMAPEQAAYAGLDVDRRSDVYSLGALLYELLTGTTPFEARALRRAAHLEVLRILKEEEPPKPSTRVHTMGKSSEPLARDRRTDPSGLAKLLRGDLDWIVMKALEKDRTRRYGNASDLAADIGRYFEERPIVARPPSFGYKARKLLRRRRGPFAAAAVMVLALVGDVAYIGWQRSRMAASEAEQGATGDQRSAMLLSSDEERCYYHSVKPSPDGARLLAVDYCQEGVYLLDLEAGTAELLGKRYAYWDAAWSPDGRKVVVGGSDGTDPPFVIDLETGARETPASLAGLALTELRWSPDGDHLSGRMKRSDGNASLVVVSLRTGERTVLADNVRMLQGAATFSPDGRHVVFSNVSGEDEDLFVREMATGARWRLAGGPGNEGGALWSPDGKTVVYGNESGMWALPVSDGRSAGSPRLVRRDPVWPSAWTKHGYYYAVSNTVTRAHSIGVDPWTGRENGRRQSIALPAGELPNVTFAWAPDMKQIAVAGWSDGKIHLLRGENSSSFSVGSEVLPSRLWWSRDGREVLYTSPPRAQRERSTSTVSVLDVETGAVRALFGRVEGIARIDVSPDEQRMVFLTDAGPPPSREIVISGLGETEGFVLARTNDYGAPRAPVFSPDGSHVLFRRGQNPSTSLWVVGADGSGERMLAEAPGIWGRTWDPTGRMVAYQIRDEGGRARLRVVSVEDGDVHEIEAFAALGEPTLQAWSPDGAWLGVTETVGQWEFWVNRDLLGQGGELGAAR